MLDTLFGLRDQANQLFDQLRAGSLDTVRGGVTRDTYGTGEQFAHDLVAHRAAELELEVRRDHLLNTYMTLPGKDRSRPAIVIGSHLDSVPAGGNYDGAAGVVAGLLAIDALKRLGIQPRRDITIMGIRAEESMWFGYSYVGSRGSLGMLKAEALDKCRVDTGKTLAQHLAGAGGDPEAVRRGEAYLKPERVAAFLELHIEQAPSLAHDGQAIAIGKAIPGNFRYPKVHILGEYGHVGLPRRFRRDAALAGADLFCWFDEIWADWDAKGRPMACTLGEFHTDPTRHGLTIVPGDFAFSLDVRAYEQSDLEELEKAFLAQVRQTEARRGVQITLGTRASAPVAKADALISDQLTRYAHALNLQAPPLLSPASHDAAAFCAAGVPYGFIFVRNRNGSHHPDEHMDIDDFLKATAVLTEWLKHEA